ncbi:MAG TPA: MiaB/RimO family radical SAM methylthiotransferase [Ktedonobacterales bacterium]|jgi:tRNA-2-methylthio-N6-dimethylallyladenosine synthase|nr:MiaB/RimO family radical SAM methylthiotransferase [Ktedonobacterales bacterium]
MSVAKGKYHVWTVGCQMNMADSQRVSSILDALGWEEVESIDEANFVVLNTCSVREQPEKKAHGQLSLLRHAKRHRTDLLVGLMGCMIGNQRQLDELQKKYPTVDLFFKVEQADILPHFLEERWTPIAGEGCVDFAELGAPRTFGYSERLPVLPMPSVQVETGLPEAPVEIPTSRPDGPMMVNFRPGARELHYPTAGATGFRPKSPTAWLPVILGCNKVCSYCIVPSRRGRERSRPMDELLAEARSLTAGDARELTLLGQTVEAYGLDLPGQPDLGDLMAALSEIEDLERIRFMTSYPRHMTDKIIRQMAALPKVCEHVNIPVQHGDDGMLQRMRRGYGIGEYRELIGRLRAWWPGVSLSTDVIVGFCGETEEEFKHTLDLLEEIRFDVVHVAMYSPRPGTLSFKWEDDVPHEVKKQRLHAVEEVQERIARELNVPYEGQTVEVLVEQHQVGNGQHQWRGRSRSNKLVFFPAAKPGDAAHASEAAQGGAAVAVEAPPAIKVQPGDLVQVYIERTSPWSLQGYLATR